MYPPAGPTFPGHVPTQLSVPGRPRAVPADADPGRRRRRGRRHRRPRRGAHPGDRRLLPRRARGATRWRAAPAARPRPRCSQSRVASTPATSGATIPAAFAGTWKRRGDDGRRRRHGRRRLAKADHVAFTFVAGARPHVHRVRRGQLQVGRDVEHADLARGDGEPCSPSTSRRPGGASPGTVTFTRHGTRPGLPLDRQHRAEHRHAAQVLRPGPDSGRASGTRPRRAGRPARRRRGASHRDCRSDPGRWPPARRRSARRARANPATAVACRWIRAEPARRGRRRAARGSVSLRPASRTSRPNAVRPASATTPAPGCPPSQARREDDQAEDEARTTAEENHLERVIPRLRILGHRTSPRP